MATNSNSLRGVLLATTALVAGAGGSLPMASTAFAQNILPSHGVVTSGAASIGQSGGSMTVNQTSAARHRQLGQLFDRSRPMASPSASRTRLPQF